MSVPAMMLRRLPSFGACQLSGHQSIARSLGAFNSTGLFHVQCGTSRSLVSRALKPVIRDPERPVKPATPWLSFLEEYRKNRKGHPLGGKETMAEASKEWKAMPDGEKKQFVDPYEAKKKIYEEKMKAYVDSGKKDAWARDPERPQAPASGYLRFAQDFRKRNPSLKLTEASKQAAVGWKELKTEEKQRYEEAYKAEREKYSKDMKAYKDSGKEDAWKAKVGITALEEKDAQKKIMEKEKAKKEKEKAQMIKAKEKAKTLQKAKLLKAKAKATMEKEKAKKDKAKQDEKAAQLKEKEKAKKATAKAKLAAEAAKIKEKANAAREKLKAKSAGTSKQARA